MQEPKYLYLYKYGVNHWFSKYLCDNILSVSTNVKWTLIVLKEYLIVLIIESRKTKV